MTLTASMARRLARRLRIRNWRMLRLPPRLRRRHTRSELDFRGSQLDRVRNLKRGCFFSFDVRSLFVPDLSLRGDRERKDPVCYVLSKRRIWVRPLVRYALRFKARFRTVSIADFCSTY